MILTLDPFIGNNAGWTVVGGSNTLDCLDDGATPDEDTTYVANTTVANSKAGVRFRNLILPAGSVVNSVAFSARIFGVVLFRHFCTDGTTTVESADKTGLGAYAEFVETYVNDPITGAAWTLATLAGWEPATSARRGFGVSNRAAVADTIRCTRLRLAVDVTLGGSVIGGGVGGGYGTVVG